jgi:NADH-quinone oxidoreductase subunit N
MDPKLGNDILMIAPMLVLTLGSVFLLLIDVFIKRSWPRGLFTILVLVGALFASNYLSLSDLYQPRLTSFNSQLFSDSYTAAATGIILFAAILVVLMSLNSISQEKVEAAGEFYALLLMSTIGAIIFVSAAEMITLFLGLEIMSMALYCLCGSALSQRASSESALKYFLLGSFSSAFLLYGIALLYGLTGSTQILAIGHALANNHSILVSVSIGLVMIGLLFKVAAVPFHFWAPDVYQGAPTTVTAYMASVIKVSAVLATMRILWLAFPENSEVWQGAFWTMAVLSMTVGNLIALRQRSVKRMLAYSSIAHAGYMMVALLVPKGSFGGAAAVFYYLIAYVVMTIGSMAVVLAISLANKDSKHADDISRFNSLSSRSPFLACCMALFMLSLAGIPPGMAGLLGKFYIFNAAVKSGFVGLAIIGMLNSAISAYYYLRVIVAMYFIESKDSEEQQKMLVGPALGSVLAFCFILVVAIGLFPSDLHDSASYVARNSLWTVSELKHFNLEK